MPIGDEEISEKTLDTSKKHSSWQTRCSASFDRIAIHSSTECVRVARDCGLGNNGGDRNT